MPDKAPVCPWCDTPKDGVSINGIRILENCGNQYGPKQKANFCPLCGRPLTEEAAMKRFEPMQKPLTLDELRQMGGEPVYIVEHPDWGHWELSEDAEDYLDREKAFYDMRCTFRKMCSSTISKTPFDLHCMGWLAFRRKPTDEERKAAKQDE